ncbi:hypothetical protein KIPB_011304, partial [Kipferlia bialata]
AFRGIVTTRRYRLVQHISWTLSTLSVLSIMCIGYYDWAWCHSQPDPEGVVYEMGFYTHIWDVAAAYLCVIGIQTLHLAAILLSMLLFKRVSERRVRQTGGVTQQGQGVHKLSLLPFVTLGMGVWYMSNSFDYQEDMYAVVQWSYRVGTALRAGMVALLVYPTQADRGERKERGHSSGGGIGIGNSHLSHSMDETRLDRQEAGLGRGVSCGYEDDGI